MSKSYTVITGASEGIGRGFAEALAAQGHNLVCIARNEARLTQLATDLQQRHGIEVRVVVQDLAEVGAAEAACAAMGNLEVSCLINNAGFQVPMGPFADTDLAEVYRMLAVNIVALTALTRLLLPRLVATRGAIINVASQAAFQPVPYMAAYAATKSYVLHFTEALERELADTYPNQVYVMALCPGATLTQFWSRSSSPVGNTRFSVMTTQAVVAVAVKALRRRRQRVVIPSLLLRAATQLLRVSTRSLNLIIARMLTGHKVNRQRQASGRDI